MAAVIKMKRRQMDYYSEPGLLSVGFMCEQHSSAEDIRG